MVSAFFSSNAVTNAPGSILVDWLAVATIGGSGGGGSSSHGGGGVLYFRCSCTCTSSTGATCYFCVLSFRLRISSWRNYVSSSLVRRRHHHYWISLVGLSC